MPSANKIDRFIIGVFVVNFFLDDTKNKIAPWLTGAIILFDNSTLQFSAKDVGFKGFPRVLVPVDLRGVVFFG